MSCWVAAQVLAGASRRWWLQRVEWRLMHQLRMLAVGFLGFLFFFFPRSRFLDVVVPHEGSAEDANSDDDDRNVGNAAAMTGGRRGKSKKRHERKKTALGHFLVLSARDGQVGECALCRQVFATPFSQIRPENITCQHKKEFEAVEAANNDGKDVAAVVTTLLSARRQRTGQMDAYVYKKPRVMERIGLLRKEVALLMWVVDSQIAPNALSGDLFDNFLNEAELKLEGHKTMAKLVPPMFEVAVEVLKEKVAEFCGGVSCAIDLWTSSAHHKYLAITYHGMTANFELQQYLLDLVWFPGTTKAKLIASVVESRIRRNVAETQLVSTVVSDGGSDAKAARESELEYYSGDCGNHDCNLALGDILQLSHLQFTTDIKTMEYFIALHQADKNLRLFFAHIQEEELGDVYAFICRAATRWLSLFRCLDRYLLLRDAILSPDEHFEALRQQILSDLPDGLAADLFSEAFFTRLVGYKDVLAPLDTMARELQRHEIPTASRIPGLV